MSISQKINFWPLGSQSRPYPMVDAKGNLGAICSNENTLFIPSLRPYADVMRLAYQGMPTPNMLATWRSFLGAWASTTHALMRPDNERPEKGRFMHAIVGPPGEGKTHQAELAGYMLDPRGAIKINLSGVNLKQAFWKTILDPQTSQPLIEQINERLNKGNIHVDTLNMLDKIFSVSADGASEGGAITREKGDTARINWQYINNNLSPEKIPDLLQLTSNMLGLRGGSSAGFHIVDVPGPIIEAYREGKPRIILLDEVDKAENHAACQSALEVLDGERPSCIIPSSDGQYFDFSFANTPPGTMIIMTGNHAEDGPSSNSINLSTLTRMAVEPIRAAQERDVVHRFQQELYGWPVSTLYYGLLGGDNAWAESPERFQQWLEDMAEGLTGKSSTGQFARWPFIKEAASRFASAWYRAVDETNPHSQTRRSITDQAAREALRHADHKHASGGLALNLRDVFRLIKSAEDPLRSATIIEKVSLSPPKSTDWSQSPIDVRPIERQAFDNGEFGTRLEGVLENYLHTRGHPELCSYLLSIFLEKKVLENRGAPHDGEIDLGHDPIQVTSLAGLLNGQQRDFSSLIKIWRQSVLLVAGKSLERAEEVKSLLSQEKVAEILPALQEAQKKAQTSDEAFLIMPQSSLAQTVRQPFAIMRPYDLMIEGVKLSGSSAPDFKKNVIAELHEAVQVMFNPEILPSVSALVAAFVMPAIGRMNWTALSNLYAPHYRYAEAIPLAVSEAIGTGGTNASRAFTDIYQPAYAGKSSSDREVYVLAAHDDHGQPVPVFLFRADKSYMIAGSVDQTLMAHVASLASNPNILIAGTNGTPAFDKISAWLDEHAFDKKVWCTQALSARLGRLYKADDTVSRIIFDNDSHNIRNALPIIMRPYQTASL